MRREDEHQLPVELATAFDALTEETAERNAPARVEMAALAAFRQAHAPGSSSSKVVAPLGLNRLAAMWIGGAVAAGLAAIIALGVVLKSEPAKPSAQPGNGVVATVPEQPGRVDTPALVEKPGGEVAAPPSQRQWQGGRDGGIQQVRNTMPSGRAKPAQIPTEITTDYYPLVSGDDLEQLIDGGQIVRMQVPRESLASFGFQMDANRADRPVTADVVLGNDGVARAIRFVQPLEIAKR